MGSQITGVSMVDTTVCSGLYLGKYKCCASLAFVRGIHRWLMNYPHKGSVTRKIFPFDDVTKIFKDLPGTNWCEDQLKILGITTKMCSFMMASSNGNISCIAGPLRVETTGHWWFHSQSPVTRSFDVFFDLHLNKRFTKQPRRWRFETPSRSLWCHCYLQGMD